MSDLFCFLDGFGSGGPLNKSILIVSVPAGSMVTATLGPQIKTAQEKNGEAWLRNLDVGEWNLKLTLGEQSATAKYNIERFGVYRTSMAFFAATIKITYPGGSTCTCSKDDRTYTAPDTSGTWDCVVDSAGDWTVQITADGKEPATEIVNIAEYGQEVVVSISYEIWIIRNGTEIKSISLKGCSKSQEDGAIKFSGGGSGYHSAYVKPVDLTGFKTMTIEGTFNVHGGSLLAIWDNNTEENNIIYSKVIASATLGKTTATLDVSEFEGEYIVGITMEAIRSHIVKNWNISR